MDTIVAQDVKLSFYDFVKISTPLEKGLYFTISHKILVFCLLKTLNNETRQIIEKYTIQISSII